MAKLCNLLRGKQTAYMSPRAVSTVCTIVRFRAQGCVARHVCSCCGDTRPFGMLHHAISANVLCDSSWTY